MGRIQKRPRDYFAKVGGFEAELKATRQVKLLEDKRTALRKAAKDLKSVLPKPPERPKGRTPNAGIGKREVLALREKAKRFLGGAGGLAALEAEVQHTALVILLIDGVLGTEPWRAQGGAHSGLMSANARFRYLENAARILADIRRAVGSQDEQAQLTEGVFDAAPDTDTVDAETVEVADGPAPKPQGT